MILRFLMAALFTPIQPNLNKKLIGQCNEISANIDFDPWEELDPKATYRLRATILGLLETISGGDMVAMLRDVLPASVIRDLPHGTALQCLGDAYMSMDGRSRRPLLVALKECRTSGGLDRAELGRCGFHIQEENWQRCDKAVHKDDQTGGRPSKAAILEPKIEALLKSSSAPINRGLTDTRKRAHSDSQADAPRRLDYTYRELYERFEDNDVISYGTFLRHCGSRYLSYSRPTDCCDHCVEGRKARKQLAQIRNRYDEQDTSLADIVNKYSDRPTHPLYTSASTIMECDEHRLHKRIQRTVYNRHTNNLASGEVTIECDWRRKGHLPLQSSQTGGAFYNDTQYALFGAAVYWCDKNGETQHHSVDVLSQSITEDTHCTLEGLRTAVRQILHNESVPCDLLGAKKIHFWSDTGPHFRSHEYIHYVLKEFPVWLGTKVRVDLNYLTEKHGKNQRDTHFRSVRSYTCRAARDSKQTIGTCSMLKDALTRAHAAVQIFNKSLNRPLQSCEFYLLNLAAKGYYQKKQMKVADLCSVYALRLDRNDLWAYTDSTYKHRVRMGYLCTSEKSSFEPITPPSKPVPTALQLTQILKKKT